ncbi:MAG: membrane protein insertase YidC [Kiritimatiellia bacterium]
MKKQDMTIVVVLLGLMLAWPYIYSYFAPPAPVPIEDPVGGPPTAAPAPEAPEPPELKAAAAVTAAATDMADESRPRGPEQRQTLAGPDLVVTVSSYGGGVTAAELLQYRQDVRQDSGPVILDFPGQAALTFAGLPGFSDGNEFELQPGPQPESVRLERTTAEGLRLIRTFTLREDYQMEISDVFANVSENSLELPEYEVRLGYMRGLTGDPREAEYLGVDGLQSIGGEGVVYWAKKIPKLFREKAKTVAAVRLPESVEEYVPQPVDWVAAKNKFFTQILTPAREQQIQAYQVLAQRVLAVGERENPALAPGKAQVDAVAAGIVFPGVTLQPGDSLERRMHYYAGPKKFSILRRLGMKQEEVMDFGMWSPVCKFLLKILTTTYRYIPNYGVAIILLTMLIRIIFWPLTHKSTESMKKMQALQPMMTELRAKHKDNPKKMQAEIMALYRQHKVNPMGGCLPMIVQIPVFIALFVVLRSAIELRFADFLWIKDLSEPERLFADILPIPLNILPLIMAVTMAWQQRLMPTTDSSQQRIMLVFMPIMMLVMFYMMPAALVLYWTTNQCIMIAQQLFHKKLGFGLLQILTGRKRDKT